MKDLIKKILKEDNDFDWVRNTNPISKSKITDELSDLQDWGYYIHERRVDTNQLVDFIYRLGLNEKELREMSGVLYDLSDSIYENGRERGQQDGWYEGHQQGYREGRYDAENDSRYKIEDAEMHGYDDGYEDGKMDMRRELENEMEEQKSIIYNKGFEEGREYESGLESEEYEKRQSGFDPRDYDEDYD